MNMLFDMNKIFSQSFVKDMEKDVMEEWRKKAAPRLIQVAYETWNEMFGNGIVSTMAPAKIDVSKAGVLLKQVKEAANQENTNLVMDRVQSLIMTLNPAADKELKEQGWYKIITNGGGVSGTGETGGGGTGGSDTTNGTTNGNDLPALPDLGGLVDAIGDAGDALGELVGLETREPKQDVADLFNGAS